jgi:hypothetical protein
MYEPLQLFLLKDFIHLDHEQISIEGFFLQESTDHGHDELPVG